MDKCPVPLTDEHKADTKDSGLASSVFIRYKNRQICRKTRLVCSKHVKQINIGSLGDESG